ncbi:MAG: succinate dehydrogenase [Myxococcales bacterium]|nr:succinate dehydrogenase [Myxococcales bacterium]
MGAHQLSFYQTTLGKKVVMAISGVILIGFVLGHMAGNLQIFLGPEKLDAYAEFLHSMPALLWGTRVVLLVSVFAHFLSAFSLWKQNKAARPRGYAKQVSQATTYAARTMKWGGVIVLLFIAYHLLHLTVGAPVAGYEIVHGKVYANVVHGFSNPAIAGFYILAQVCLGLHLFHGTWSLMQTLGLNHNKYNPLRRNIATGVSLLITIGNISIPVSVLTGLLS